MDVWTDDGFLMRSASIRRVVVLAAVWLAMASAAAAQAPKDSLPAEVTPAVIAEGKKLFGGAGLCLACHGTDGKGGIGPDLTDATWLHGTGTFAELIARIKSGTDIGESKTGQIMPPMGGATLSDGQLRAVAAYVWTLSHKKK